MGVDQKYFATQLLIQVQEAREYTSHLKKRVGSFSLPLKSGTRKT
jgi:hypothetical protein